MANKMISVIIPMKKISNFLLDENLPAFQRQSNKNFEVIVVCDFVDVIDVSLQKKYKWLKIIEHPGSPSEKRNFGVKKARGGILAFIDDDAYPHSNWINNIVGAGLRPAPWGGSSDPPLRKKNTTVICGPGVLPENVSFSEKVFDSILTSKFGSASFTYRFQKENARFVDDYPLMNFAILKSVYQKFGGLLNHWPGEDSKLCEKIINSGFKIKYSPEIVVFHHRKNNLIEFLKQHSRYGFKRGYFFTEGDKNSRKIVYLLPSSFLIYLVLLPIFIFLIKNYFILLPVFIYFIFVIIFFTYQNYKKRDIFLSFVSSGVLVLLHLTYAIFFVKGFVRGFLRVFKG